MPLACAPLHAALPLETEKSEIAAPMERKTSLFHRRRRVHTILIALFCLVDSAVIKEDTV